MTIQAKVATVLKTSLHQSQELHSSQKNTIYKGQALQVKKITPAPHQHLLVELIDHEFERGYIYAPHWNYQSEELILPVSYYYQGDNPSGEGYRECCGTSNAIMLNGVLNGWLDAEAARLGKRQPESIYLERLAEYGDTTNHDANTRALRDFGVDSYWSTSLILEDFYLSIRNGIPLVMGLDYKGPDQGHIVTGVGFKTKERTIIIHDPNGSRLGATDEWISNLPEAGKNDVYGVETVENLWFPGNSKGWGRIVTHINGVPTVFADN